MAKDYGPMIKSSSFIMAQMIAVDVSDRKIYQNSANQEKWCHKVNWTQMSRCFKAFGRIDSDKKLKPLKPLFMALSGFISRV